MKTVVGASGIALLCLLAPVRAFALPTLQSASQTQDDAKVTLVIPTQAIKDDIRTFCEVEVEVKGDLVQLTAGDTVNVSVHEADVGFDDEIFQTVFNVTNQEVQANLVDRVFDCSGDFQGDGNSTYEVYAILSVNKSACGFWNCLQDTPSTQSLDVAARVDDDREANDIQSQAAALPMGATAGYIARDDDWFALDVSEPSRLLLDVPHRAASGSLVVTLVDSAGSMIVAGVPTEESNVVQYEPLLAGNYAVFIAPENPDDFVFYGLNASVESVSGDCTTGDVDTVPCGNCGTRTRQCVGGFWGPFTECTSNAGICSPGETTTASCGACGQRVDRCSDSCQWVPGACTDDCAEGTAVLGEACRSTVNCEPGLSCLSEAEYPAFTGGYCSATPCDSQSACGAGGVCANVFGRSFCLESCTQTAECRVGYECIETGTGRACVPRCTGDSDCGDPNAPVCDAPTGECVPGVRSDGSSNRGGGNPSGGGALV
ncbi:MAG: hypothetical protein AAFY60_10835, partial [Myxococcota bacterium]